MRESGKDTPEEVAIVDAVGVVTMEEAIVRFAL